jgi:hypothetical protein
MLVCVLIAAAPGVQAQSSGTLPQVTPQQFAEYALRFIRYSQKSRTEASVLVLFGAAAETRAEELERQLVARAAPIYGAPVRVEKLLVDSTATVTRLAAASRATRRAALIAVDIPASAVNALAQAARSGRVLTISTRREDLTMLSLAIVAETSAGKTQVRIYRNKVALSKENVKLPSDVLALTREVTTDPVENYRQGIRAFDFDEWREVQSRMEAAFRSKEDNPRDVVIIYGLRVQAYVPSVYLGAALAKAGDCTGAKPFLDRYVTNDRGLTDEEKRLVAESRRKCNDGGRT